MNPDDFEADLLTGLAELLAGEIAGAVWRTTSGYTAAETGIVLDVAPETLNRVIQLSLYPVTDDPVGASDEIGLQVVTRWEGQDPRPCRRLDTQVFNRLQGRAHFVLSTGIHVVSAARQSGASLGVDSSKRWGRSSNYYVRVSRPATYRL